MPEEERLRRRALRRRPEMIMRARELGLLTDAEDNWTTVRSKRGKSPK